MLQILEAYDLSPYRERIEKTFADNKNKKIQEEIAKVFGGKSSKAGKTKSAAKGKVRTFDAKNGYRIDAYVDGVVKAAFKAAMAKKKKIPQPLTSIKLGGMPDEVQLNVLILEGEGETLELEVTPPKTKIPGHIDDDTGAPLRQFAKKHGLDEDDDEAPNWGDMYKLPWCALIHEQILGVTALAKMPAEAGIKVAKGCKLGAGESDNFWEAGDRFDEKAREEIAALVEDQQADFAALCFESPAKQRWLVTGKGS